MTDAAEPHDAGPAPEESRSPPPAFERSISPIAGQLGSRMAGKAVVLAALVAGCGVFVAATWGHDKAPPEPERDEPARQVVPFEPASPASPTLAAPGVNSPGLGPEQAGGQVPAIQPSAGVKTGAADAATRRQAEVNTIRGAPILAYSRGGGAATPIAPVLASHDGPAREATELEQLGRGSSIGQARAARLPDRNFLIVAGANLPCILQTAMESTTPGYVSCLIPRDVLSDNGAVVLMEKGTKVLGEYRSSLRQGQRRLFVLWTRAVTPAGVAIALGSPAADPVGRAGFDGEIDTHFWDRFGGALLLSIVDDAVSAVAGPDNGANVTRLPSDAAGMAVQNSINIAPSLRKAQGSEVSIFVAQDFDFSGVYGLRSR
ncbi:MAG: type IV secretion system protein VirB10 [Phenylobacterium sp.]|uniref:type IV secretion system protein VirB10 n=1 Tax=Phenylobacterium sp. TaxID=1871053 RepID=UPI001B471CD4|nr:type IV secretion system protein VirB10 [Phenylobacterium sp.]MBP7817086.1 type IV secretion system protein VirB10 [Phenylobacterium sp.]